MLSLSDIINAGHYYYDRDGNFDDYLKQFTEKEINYAAAYVMDNYTSCDYSGKWYGCFITFLDGVNYAKLNMDSIKK